MGICSNIVKKRKGKRKRKRKRNITLTGKINHTKSLTKHELNEKNKNFSKMMISKIQFLIEKIQKIQHIIKL